MITKRKGISTFIATLLLMVLAVAAGVVIYAYTMGYLGSMGGPQTLGSISLDSSSLKPGVTTGFALQAYIRNIGRTTFTIDSVYINGVKVGARVMKDNGATPPVPYAIDDTDLSHVNRQGYYFSYPSGTSIPENGVGTLFIDVNPLIDSGQSSVLANGFVSAVTYDIKIIGRDNTQLSFQIKG